MRRKTRSILFLVTLLSACSAEAPEPENGFQRPEDVESLFVSHGPENADTTVIFVQGGPFPDLRTNLIEALPEMAGRRRVVVHQPWTLDPDLLYAPELVSVAEAARLNLEALEMLDQVVRHFLHEGTALCVVGHSYGAFLTLLWVATYDRPISTVVLAGRVTLPEIVWNNFRDGRLYWFPDGITPEPLEGETPEERIVAMRIQADVGSRPFTRLLSGQDLSRMTFVYGSQDRLVGTLTPNELEFLRSRGAHVVQLAGGDHRSMFDTAYAGSMKGSSSCGG